MPAWRASRKKDLFNESPAAMMYCLNRFRPRELQTAVLRAQKTFEERLAGDTVTTIVARGGSEGVAEMADPNSNVSELDPWRSRAAAASNKEPRIGLRERGVGNFGALLWISMVAILAKKAL
jgi:hypothetical protein